MKNNNPFSTRRSSDLVLNAPWVTPEQKAGAEAFQKFLAEKITPELAAQSSFRPAALDQKPVAPITAANGVDPEQPKRDRKSTRLNSSYGYISYAVFRL